MVTGEPVRPRPAVPRHPATTRTSSTRTTCPPRPCLRSLDAPSDRMARRPIHGLLRPTADTSRRATRRSPDTGVVHAAGPRRRGTPRSRSAGWLVRHWVPGAPAAGVRRPSAARARDIRVGDVGVGPVAARALRRLAPSLPWVAVGARLLVRRVPGNGLGMGRPGASWPFWPAVVHVKTPFDGRSRRIRYPSEREPHRSRGGRRVTSSQASGPIEMAGLRRPGPGSTRTIWKRSLCPPAEEGPSRVHQPRRRPRRRRPSPQPPFSDDRSQEHPGWTGPMAPVPDHGEEMKTNFHQVVDTGGSRLLVCRNRGK